MFAFKEKKGGSAAPITPPSDSKTFVSSHSTLRNSIRKVVAVSKNICQSFSATLSSKISLSLSLTKRSTSPIRLSSDAPTATTSSYHKSVICSSDPLLRLSPNSTAPTERSLPHLDCGEAFYVPGISPSPESRSDLEQSSVQEEDGLSLHSMTTITPVFTTNSADQAKEEISAKPEELSVKKGKTDRLRRRLKATCMKFVLPQFMVPRPPKPHPDESGSYNSDIGAGALPDVNAAKQYEATMTDADESDEDEGGYPRCDVKIIEAIPDEKYRELFKACELSSFSTIKVDVVRREKGTFNAATFVTVCEDGQTRKYIVRVPGHGTPSHWTEEDAYVLKNEAQLIEYIRKNTTAPVAQVIDYSTGHNNALGFPYILMTMLPGTPARNIWFPRDYPSVDTDLVFRNADVPPPHVEKKRVNFLRSLAQVMTQIHSLEFEAIGVPLFDDEGALTGIGPTCHWNHHGGDQAFKRQPAATTEEYFQARMKAKVKQLNGRRDPCDSESSFKCNGTRTMLTLIFTQPAFHGPADETFTLHHNDLDLQNILVDDEGNVTGIIDWDNAIAAPRCIGATAVPMFLRNDWFPNYTFGLQVPPCMAWNYQHYREIYAAATIEAGTVDNAKFTLKSGLYQAAVAVVTAGGDEEDLIPKLLREIPHCRVDPDEFIKGLGMGAWHAAMRMLETHFARIFEPELPPVGLLEALDADLEVQITWWSCCDELLAFYETEKPVRASELADSAPGSRHGSAAGEG